LKFNIRSMDLCFNEHPYDKIGIIIYFSGCNKALNNVPCQFNGKKCHNMDLWHILDEDYKSWDEIREELNSFINNNLLEIETIVYCGGEPIDSLPQLNAISELIHEEFPKIEQVLFTHYTSLPKELNTKHITWVKYGEFGTRQYYENIRTKEVKELGNGN